MAADYPVADGLCFLGARKMEKPGCVYGGTVQKKAWCI